MFVIKVCNYWDNLIFFVVKIKYNAWNTSYESNDIIIITVLIKEKNVS